jgi:hypothetical protein
VVRQHAQGGLQPESQEIVQDHQGEEVLPVYLVKPGDAENQGRAGGVDQGVGQTVKSQVVY